MPLGALGYVPCTAEEENDDVASQALQASQASQFFKTSSGLFRSYLFLVERKRFWDAQYLSIGGICAEHEMQHCTAFKYYWSLGGILGQCHHGLSTVLFLILKYTPCTELFVSNRYTMLLYKNSPL